MKISTTVKISLDSELRKRITPLARAARMTPHAWMVGALAEQVGLAEARASFVRDAQESSAEVRRTGVAFDANEVFEYLAGRGLGEETRRPRARRLR
jgi:predicted transcriptional regulator